MLFISILVASCLIVVTTAAYLLIRQQQSKKVANENYLQPTESHFSKKYVVRILFGTQTGTAERFAKQLGSKIMTIYGEHVAVEVKDMEYLDMSQLSSWPMAFFLVATYGDGEPTDSAMALDSWLTEKCSDEENGELMNDVKGLKYGVFGLGNKQYEHYNAFGKKVHRQLQQLGATSIVDRGDGDDDDNIDEDFEDWVEKVIDCLSTVGFQENTTKEASLDDLISYEIIQHLPNEAVTHPMGSGTGRELHSPALADISHQHELYSPTSNRSCLHVEIDISKLKVTYESGDHIAVFAELDDAIVEEVGKYLTLPLDSIVSMAKPANDAMCSTLPNPIPGPLQLRQAVQLYADVFAHPSKTTLRALARVAADAAQAARLEHLAAPAGRTDYHEYVSNHGRCILELLRDFPSLLGVIPPGLFFAHVCPRLHPRFYSISSSPALHPNHVHITCSVVDEIVATGRRHLGLCSTWLKKCNEGVPAPVFLRTSHFRLPPSHETPVVMVGPGTGLAPFRGFLQERAAAQQRGATLGTALLFYGCRHPDQDYLYQEELTEYNQSGVISELHVAFSRLGPDKVYVQDLMRKKGRQLWDLLAKKGAWLYVCGDAKRMARDVNTTLLRISEKQGQLQGHQAEAFVKKISDEGRYQRDVW